MGAVCILTKEPVITSRKYLVHPQDRKMTSTPLNIFVPAWSVLCWDTVKKLWIGIWIRKSLRWCELFCRNTFSSSFSGSSFIKSALWCFGFFQIYFASQNILCFLCCSLPTLLRFPLFSVLMYLSFLPITHFFMTDELLYSSVRQDNK